MAFRIIIDGYNLIGGPRGLGGGGLENQRDRLIRRLSAYRRRKGFPITVVFDGWGSGEAEEHGEKREGVDVVFSRHGEKADSVVVRMARELGEGALIVSSDREVGRQSLSAGAVSISSQEFEDRLNRIAFSETENEDPEEDDYGASRKKKGNPRKLSKKERKKKLRLNKL